MTVNDTALRTFIQQGENMRSHEAFAGALRRYALDLVRLYRSSPILNKIVNEEGRFLISSLALQLHLHRDPRDPADGLTLSRLRELCAAHGVASPGRVTAFLGLMRMAGFVAPKPTEDRRSKLLVPTARLWDHVRIYTVIHMRGIEALNPGTSYLARLDHDAAFLENFHRAAGGYYLRGTRLPDGFPELAVFTSADAGYMVLLSIFLQLPLEGGRAQPGTVDLPLTPTAKRFGVSRSHLVNLLRAAQAAGFLEVSGSGGRGVDVAPSLISLLERWFGANMALMSQSASEAALRAAA